MKASTVTIAAPIISENTLDIDGVIKSYRNKMREIESLIKKLNIKEFYWADKSYDIYYPPCYGNIPKNHLHLQLNAALCIKDAGQKTIFSKQLKKAGFHVDHYKSHYDPKKRHFYCYLYINSAEQIILKSEAGVFDKLVENSKPLRSFLAKRDTQDITTKFYLNKTDPKLNKIQFYTGNMQLEATFKKEKDALQATKELATTFSQFNYHLQMNLY